MVLSFPHQALMIVIVKELREVNFGIRGNNKQRFMKNTLRPVTSAQQPC